MEIPARDPVSEYPYTLEEVIKQVELSGVNLGESPRKRINSLISAGLMPLPDNGRYPAWTVQRIIAIENKLMEGKSLQEIRRQVKSERKRFLSQVTDLDSMSRLYKKFSNNALFAVLSYALVAMVAFGFLAVTLAPENPVVVAGQNTVKAALDAGENIAKKAASPVGRTLVTIIKTSKPEDTESVDPLGLTNLEVETPITPENLVQLDAFGDLILTGLVNALGFLGSGEGLTNLSWTSFANRPKVLSALDGVENDGSNVDLVAGSGINISPNDEENTIIISGLLDFSSQFIFKHIAVSGQSNIEVDLNADTLTFSAGSNINLSTNASTDTLTIAASGVINDHGALTGLLDDDHTQYALLAGRSGGQTLLGGTGAGDDLTLRGTSNAAPGVVEIHQLSNLRLSSNVIEDFAGNPRFTIAIGIPSVTINTGSGSVTEIAGDLQIGGTDIRNSAGATLITLITTSPRVAIYDDLDMTNNTILNIGAAGTDFTAGGGLNIATDLDVNGHIAAGNNVSIDANRVININENFTGTLSFFGEIIDISYQGTNPGIYLKGLGINSRWKGTGASNGFQVYGAQFSASQEGDTSVSTLVGIQAQSSSQAGAAGTITNAYAGLFQSFFIGPKPSTSYGINIANFGAAGVTNSYGLYIADQAGSATNYSIYQTGTGGSNILNADTRIGSTIAPTVALDVTGDFNLSGNITAGSATSTHTLNGMLCVRNATACPAQAAGRLYVDTAGGSADDPGDVFDVAEIYTSIHSVLQGEVVSAAGGGMVKKSSGGYDSAILGVASSHPAVLIEEGTFSVGVDKNRYNPLKPWVALAGRVPTKVSAENGDVSAGDPLTSSNTPGVAMKTTESGPIIGKALEAYKGSGVGKIMVFVSTGWYVAPLAGSDDLATSLALITDLDVETLIATTLRAEKIFTNELVVSGKTSGSDQVKSGQKSVAVENNRVKPSSKILITFTSDYSPATRFWVSKKEGERFSVHLDQSVAKDSTFDWLIIN